MTMRVLRYEVPVDDETHAVPCGHGPIIHVDCRRPDVVEFWRAVDDQDVEASTALRTFLVVGTGQEIPVGGTVLGTALTPELAFMGRPRGAAVWHLVELYAAEPRTEVRADVEPFAEPMARAAQPISLENLNPGGPRRFA